MLQLWIAPVAYVRRVIPSKTHHFWPICKWHYYNFDHFSWFKKKCSFFFFSDCFLCVCVGMGYTASCTPSLHMRMSCIPVVFHVYHISLCVLRWEGRVRWMKEDRRRNRCHDVLFWFGTWGTLAPQPPRSRRCKPLRIRDGIAVILWVYEGL